MKKLFTSMILMLLCMSMSAANDAKTVVATVMDSPQTIGNWDNTIEVAGDLFTKAGAKSDDYIRVNYTVTEEGAQIQLCANVPSWYNILPCMDVTSENKYVELQLTDEMLANIVADKLFVQGKQLTIESVQIVREGVADGISEVVTVKDGATGYYTINGVRLAEKPQHGVYIHNGKKYIVR